MKRLLPILLAMRTIFSWDGIETSSSIFEGVPDANINRHVSTSTGEYYIAESDILAPGIEPLTVTRIYLSEGSAHRRDKWTILPHLELHERKGFSDLLITYDPDGSPLVFRAYQNSPDFFFDTDQIGNTVTNISSGRISGQTNYKNYKAYRFTQLHLEITTATGIKRNYRRQATSGSKYFLIEEGLPNGNKIVYDYDASSRISSITSYNGHKTKRYARLNFHYDDRRQYLTITTHTGDWAKYFYTKGKDDEGELHRSFCEFESNIHQKEKINFQLFVDWQKFTVEERSYADNYSETIRYYQPSGQYNIHGHGAFKLKNDDPRIGKVESVGIDFEGNKNPAFLYQILYHIPEKAGGEYRYNPVTEVVYATHAREKYVFSKKYRLENKILVNEYDEELSATEYHWDDSPRRTGNLKKKVQSAYGSAYLSSEYTYNDENDLIKETISGDLTGDSGEQFETYYSIIGGEHHLIGEKSDSDGRKELYTYLTGTNLPQRIIFCSDKDTLQRRLFFTYDEDYLLIEKIEDDGTGEDKNDISGAYYRKRTLIKRRNAHPALGFPEEIAEYGYDFIDKTEKLIRKSKYRYNKKAQIMGIDTYDSNDVYRYTCYYDYDAAGRCTHESDPIGRETVRSYTKNGQIKTEKKANTHQTVNKKYDNGYRLIAETITTPDKLAKSHKYAYNMLSHLISETDELGNVTSYVNDGFGHLIYQKVLDVDGNVAETKFDDYFDGKPRVIAHPENRTTYIQYTGLGKKKVEMPINRLSLVKRYYPCGLLKSTEETSVTTHYTYDSLKRVISEKTISHKNPQEFRTTAKRYSGCHLLEETDFRGIKTEYSYDYAGRKKSEQCLTRKELWEYDSLGRVSSEKLYSANLLIYDKLYAYDLAGRKIEEKYLNKNGEILSHITYRYDNADNVIEKKTIKGESTGLYTAEYDGFNRVIKETSRSGDTTLYEYIDGISHRGLQCRLKKTYHSNGRIQEEIYHPNGNLLHREEKSPFSEQTIKETYTYNLMGELIKQQFDGPQQVVISYNRDRRGRILAIEELLDNKFITTKLSYNQKNLLIEKKKPDGVSIYRDYDDFDQEIYLATSDDSVHYTKTFSKKGFLIEGHSKPSNKTTYRSYDQNGNLEKETFEHGFEITHHTDVIGRRVCTAFENKTAILYQYRGEKLKKISMKKAGAPPQTLHTYDTYDEEGSLTQETRGDGSVSTYTYDKAGRFLTSSSSTYSETVSAYSESGNILSHTIFSKNTYTYDTFDQVTAENVASYHFNTYNQLLEKNRIALVTKEMRTIRYNDATYQYDRCGRRIKKITPKGETTYSYDGLDRLTKITTPTDTISYTYDVLNRLISEVINGTIKHYIYDDTLEIGATDANHNLRELRILGLGLGGATGSAIALFLDGKHYIPVSDIIGNIRAIYDIDQTLIEAYNPSIFGEGIEENTISPWVYQSKRYNPKTGLIHFGDRFYDPEIIAWISPDPLSYHEGPNLYHFLKNNPFRYNDEYGSEISPTDSWTPAHGPRNNYYVPSSRDLRPSEDPYCYYESSFKNCGESRISSLQLDNMQRNFSLNCLENDSNFILLINGILTNYQETTEMAKYVSNFAKGKNVYYVYNQTHGAYNDIFVESLSNLKGVSTKPTKLIQSFLSKAYSYHGDQLRVLIIPHSQGAIHLYNALAGLDPELRKCVHVLNIAGARNTPSEFAASSINYRAVFYRDPVPYLQYAYASIHPNPVAYAIEICKPTNIRTLKSHHKAPSLDHSFFSPTYEEAMQEKIQDYMKGIDL